jgi:hypothetical protein
MPYEYDRLGLTEESISKIQMVQRITIKILHYLPFEIGKYTDHGVAHSEDLEDLFVSLIKTNAYINLSEKEKFLIILAIWTHDIGNIIDRLTHEKKSVDILNEMPFFSSLKSQIGSQHFACLIDIIYSHRADYDLIGMEERHYHHDVRTKLVCALFRLLDSCDLSYNRNSIQFYDILKKYNPLEPEHIPHWEGHNSIDSVTINEYVIEIGYSDITKSKFLIDHLKDDLKKINPIFTSTPYNFSPFTVHEFNIT